MDIEKEAIYETDVLVMGTDGLWDVTSNERVAEIVQRTLEQFPAEDDSRYRYRFTSAAQDLVMGSRGKLNERSWRTSDNKSATIDDISVFVIPIAAYKDEYQRWKQEVESQNQRTVKPNDVAVESTSLDDAPEPESKAESEPLTVEEVVPSKPYVLQLDPDSPGDQLPPADAEKMSEESTDLSNHQVKTDLSDESQS